MGETEPARIAHTRHMSAIGLSKGDSAKPAEGARAFGRPTQTRLMVPSLGVYRWTLPDCFPRGLP